MIYFDIYEITVGPLDSKKSSWANLISHKSRQALSNC